MRWAHVGHMWQAGVAVGSNYLPNRAESSLQQQMVVGLSSSCGVGVRWAPLPGKSSRVTNPLVTQLLLSLTANMTTEAQLRAAEPTFPGFGIPEGSVAWPCEITTYQALKRIQSTCIEGTKRKGSGENKCYTVILGALTPGAKHDGRRSCYGRKQKCSSYVVQVCLWAGTVSNSWPCTHHSVTSPSFPQSVIHLWLHLFTRVEPFTITFTSACST
jgi:hypothetical protein